LNIKELVVTNYLRFFVRAFGAVISLSTFVWLAKLLSPSDLGMLIEVLTCLNLYVIFSKLGVDVLLTREVSINNRNDKNRKITTLGLISIIILGFAFSAFVSKFYNIPLFAWGLLIFVPISAVYFVYMRSQGLFEIADFIELLARPVVFIMLVALFFYLTDLNYIKVFISYILSYFLIVIVALWLLIIAGKQVPKIAKSISQSDALTVLKGSRSYLVLALISYVYFQMDTLIVAAYLDENQVAIYGVASNFTRAITFITFIFIAYLQPKLASMGELPASKLFKYYERVNLLQSFFVFLIFTILGWFILGWMNPVYTEGYLSMQILNLAHVANSYVVFRCAYYNMRGKQDDYVKYFIFGGMLALISNIILVPVYGIEGAAVSLFIGLSFVIFVFKSKKSLEI
jgi:O-antigen/teichoic acid export membrane protein